MAWTNVILCFYINIYTWRCSRGSVAVDIQCRWNQTLPVGHNVSAVCHASVQDSTRICSLCRLHVITSEQRRQLPCANITRPFTIPAAAPHRHAHCTLQCPPNTASACNITVLGGYPPHPPSRPECSIEDMEEGDIHCSWSTSNETMTPTTYTLHWQDYDGNINYRESVNESGVIKRIEYMKNTDVKVWVTATNVLGSVQSELSVFNTGNIIRPSPPNITHHVSQPLEIFWMMNCEIVGVSDMSCQVQHRTVSDADWTEVEDHQAMFLLEDTQPFTEYQFRVRCRCGHEEEVLSHWSSVYSVTTPPAAPVGKLDVWSDCAPDSGTSFCNVFWKEMPVSQARGEINNYNVRLKLEDGTESEQVTRQRRDTESQGCRRLRRFPLLPGVTGVFVSANTSGGVSEPTFMAFPVRGQSRSDVNLKVTGMNQKLVVSWSVPSTFSENIQEYVVQSAELPHPPCLNWVRVNQTQSSVTLTGDFRNYTAYNVSLFTVNKHQTSSFLKSAVAYTEQGVPPEVPQFHVKNITHSSVTLVWSHIPVHESKGLVLQYSVGLHDATGFNVSSDETSMQILDLQPAQQYQAWVSAVTAAGEGARSITTFSTNDKPGYISSALLVVFIVLPLFVLTLLMTFIFMLRSPVETLCFKAIPDPTNSKSFKHANFQHVWPGLCSPSESALKISELEVVENLMSIPAAPPSDTELKKDSLHVEDQIPDEVHRDIEDGEKNTEEPAEPKREPVSEHSGLRKDYSEMVDTDEEEGGADEEEDEGWGEEHFVSDYERHFMPTEVI